MSETLQDSENASPLVRSQSEAILEDRHGATPAPHAGDEPNIPPSYGRSKTFTTLSSLDTFQDQNPQLSERDSIFATTYHSTESNAATPQQRPHRDSKHDPSHDVNTKLQLPPSLLSHGGASSSTPSKGRPWSAVTPLSVLTKQLHQFDSDWVYSGRSLDDGGLGSVSNAHGNQERATSEFIKDRPANRSLFATTSHPTNQGPLHITHDTHLSPIRSSLTQITKSSAMYATRDRKMTTTNESARAGGTGRLGIDREEGRAQQIEATIASDEPVPHARSRKASHYLGIFREKEGLQNRKRSKEKRSDTTIGGDSSAQDLYPPISNESVEDVAEKNFFKGPLGETLLEINKYDETNRLRRPQGSVATPAMSRSSTQATTTIPSLFSERSSIAKSSEDETSSLDEEPSQGVVESSIEWRSGEQSQGSLPLRLLEEIRDHRRKRDNKHTVSRASQDFQIAHETVQAPTLTGWGKRSRSRSSPSGVVRSEDDEEDSDKERISSATYYPHHAPSPDTIADHHHLDQAQLQQEYSSFSRLPPKALDPDFEGVRISDALPASTHSASASISESLNRKERQLRSPATEPRKYDSGWSVVSSASDTDYESVDDLGRSDQESDIGGLQEGEITPTATPHAYSYLRTQPKRGRKPLQAVKLQPYKHQVGGHTKVFSFSRRAICKQLNNRENVFYEVIERNHPQLLQFLPKYLGVLNVTYQKEAKQKGPTKSLKTLPQTDGPIPSSEVLKDAEIRQGDNTNDALSPAPAPRVISHSKQYDGKEEIVPQVVYANNLHIIPTNLFRMKPRAPSAHSPSPKHVNWQNSNGIAEQHTRSLRDLDALQGSNSNGSPPSWGATTVNTEFKEKVLREVFSPSQVHQRRRGHNRRNRHGFKSINHKGERYSEFADSSDLPSRPSTTGRQEIGLTQFEQPEGVRVQQIQGEHAVKLRRGCENGHSRCQDSSQSGNPVFANGQKTVDGDAKDRLARKSSIKRRRSGGGLRRKQVDVDDSKRSEFEYYEESGCYGDRQDVFNMELLSQTSPAIAVGKKTDTTGITSSYKGVNKDESSKNSTASSETDMESDRGTVDIPRSTPAVPSNPLEAQQQSDERVQHFLLLEDLTADMSRPCVLDLKMGTRQYGIEASKKKRDSQRQKCKSTTSRQLGVRLCGMQVWNAKTSEYTFEDKYAGRDVRAGRAFQDALLRFLSNGRSDKASLKHIPRLLEKLSKLEEIIAGLPGYRFYASSLLVLYEGQQEEEEETAADSGASARASGSDRSRKSKNSNIDVRLVDFANCVTAEDELRQDTPCPPHDRFGIDRGYIRGLRTLRSYLKEIWKEVHNGDRAERGETEKRDLPVGLRETFEDDPGNVSV